MSGAKIGQEMREFVHNMAGSKITGNRNPPGSGAGWIRDPVWEGENLNKSLSL